jgi:hypothetical protein
MVPKLVICNVVVTLGEHELLCVTCVLGASVDIQACLLAIDLVTRDAGVAFLNPTP